MEQDVCWYTLSDDFERVGLFPIKTNEAGDYICPKCGKPATYWEGTVIQDIMGNDISGWSWDCHDCAIGTAVQEF